MRAPVSQDLGDLSQIGAFGKGCKHRGGATMQQPIFLSKVFEIATQDWRSKSGEFSHHRALMRVR